MGNFNVEKLSFTYPEKKDKTLDNISFTVRQGEFILLFGKSGCGKTTLLRLLKSSLSPFGKIDGNIVFNGRPLLDYDVKEQASEIGFVMQNPDNQLVTDKVWHELSFGLESLGYKTPEIRMRVSEMASFFGIQEWFYKNVSELSGGQKQILNLASVMVMQPSVLILDEPTSQLDPIAAGEFINILEKINRELGVTVIITEHRLEDVFSVADRVILMDNGRIVADDVPEKMGKILKNINHDMYKALPTPMRVYEAVPNSLPCPVTIRDGKYWLSEFAKKNELNPDLIPKDPPQSDFVEIAVEVKGAYFRYEKNLPDIIKGLDMTVKKGELFCLVGGNGTGKTTALSLVSGINLPQRGDVFINGQSIIRSKNLYNGLLGVLPQNPQSVFVKKTIYLDLIDILKEKKVPEEEKEARVWKVSLLCGIEDVLERHPFDLSGGEQQRAALAKILLMEPEILILDEPTKGMDSHFKEEFAEILLEMKSEGKTIIMVSHDIEFCAEYADRCALFFDGDITSVGAPREFFKGKNFYTTSANRMARNHLPEAILSEDIILACGGDKEKKEKSICSRELRDNDDISYPEKENTKKTEIHPMQFDEHGKKLTKRTLSISLLTIALIFLTIYAGVFLFGNRRYYLTSLLVIIESMIPFFMMFESRKPKARELIIISVLCALAVAGRAVFYMIPQFKPVIFIVIITGVCFGGETGFLVGIVSGFVSNFFFGQGPWTPWQMFAFGIVGFLAGVFFKNRLVKTTRVSLSLFGVLTTLIVYGGIMNSASVIMWQNKITWKMLASAYVAGLPFDLIHAFSNVLFIWFISDVMIEKLERVKIKYGLIKN